ncbi:MAG TPA: L,D-transpeptidase [Devosia sp.]|jgi:lipoprotein-anchoring transpeptidase ErfK/SrfK|nr:L,D-transpeptidase [Devosia sp.]
MTAAVLTPSRRAFIAGGASLAALTLAGCATSRRLEVPEAPQFSEYYLQMYGPIPNERFPIPAIDLTKLDPTMLRTQVPDPTGEAPGTIVVNTGERHLYLVLEGGQAIRYGVGIGRDGFTWQGRAKVGRKAEWPTWTPTKEMMERQPETREFAGGMPPGLTNPLGARALYIYQDGRDTLYRLHGTMEVWSIGGAVSSGCVRLLFHDVIDLYNRAPVGTPIVVNA